MNLDDAKENIQPLASGRNIHQLQTALSAESHEDVQAQLLRERHEYEDAIREYRGDDPLAAWYEYVLWVEQSYPRSGKESALDDVIQKCLVTFDSDERYQQDARMIKLYIKYIDGQPNPTEHYQTLYASGIGTRCAELYLCWAYYFDVADQFERAEDVYRKGRDAHAEPRDQLEQAHRQFGFSMSQRLLHKETYRPNFLSTMEERRNALTSLRSHRGVAGGRAAAKVGSLRTGAAVRSLVPGRLDQAPPRTAAGGSNVKFEVYDENSGETPPAVPAIQVPPAASRKSVVQTIIDSSRRQENLREAGPWSRAGSSRQQPLFDASKPSAPAFPICEDMDCTVAPIEGSEAVADLAIRLLPRHLRHNTAQRPFPVAEFVEEAVAANAFPAYDKCMLFPSADRSYSLEELRAFRWFRRRGVQNPFVRELDAVWGDAQDGRLRQYPLFQRSNDPMDAQPVERVVPEEAISAGRAVIRAPMHWIYPGRPGDAEQSMDEWLAMRWAAGLLPLSERDDDEEVAGDGDGDMELGDVSPVDENVLDFTVAVRGRQSICGGAVRKSIVPGGRRSIRPTMSADETMRRRTLVQMAEGSADGAGKAAAAAEPLRRLSVRPVEAKIPCAVIEEEELSPQQQRPPPALQPTVPKTTHPVQFNSTIDFAVPVAMPKTTGTIRKSMIASQRPRVEFTPTPLTTLSQSVAESPAPPAAAELPAVAADEMADDSAEPALEIAAPPVALPFAIFEDTIPDRLPTPDPVFKAPLATATEFLQARKPLAVRIKSPEPPVAAEQTAFLPNETCSTQQFNFFIKAQSISTPKAKRAAAAQALSAAESSPTQLAAAAATVSGPRQAFSTTTTAPISAPTTSTSSASIVSGSPEYAADNVSPVAIAPRQLSTIMETTESATHLNSTSSDSGSKTSQGVIASTTVTDSFPFAARPLTNYGLTLATPAPAEMPSFCPIQVYEDRTETLPIVGHLQRPNNATMLQPPSEMSQQQLAYRDLTMPPIEIYQDPTDQMPAIPQAAIGAGGPVNVLCDRLTMMQQPDISLMPGPLGLAEESMAALAADIAGHELPALPPPIGQSTAADALPKATSPPVIVKAEPNRTVAASHSPVNLVDDEDDDYLDMFTRTPGKVAAASAAANSRCIQPQLAAARFALSPGSPPPAAAIVGAAAAAADSSAFLLEPMARHQISAQIDAQPTATALQQQSLHIKQERMDEDEGQLPTAAAMRIDTVAVGVNFSFSLDEIEMAQAQLNNEYDDNDFTIEEVMDGDGGADVVMTKPPPPPVSSAAAAPASATIERPYEPEESIYVPRPIVANYCEADLDDGLDTNAPAHTGDYIAPPVDLNATRQVIQTHLVDHQADPFDPRVQSAFLDQCDFHNYLGNLPACQLAQTIRPLQLRQELRIAGHDFEVQTKLGQGQFGQVFGARDQRTGVMWALKQQRPANLWEYYICLEIESRIDVAKIMCAFMRVECALIGNNAGVLVSEWSRYGSLLAVCNTVKEATKKNVAEPVVMMLSIQLLSAIDHLHACNIIHADIKPDNILLMRRLTYDHDVMCLQLIDFGQAIDLQLYPSGQTFRSKLATKNFVCTEMLEDRPWLHQTDLFCAASTIHTMLFGTWMKVQRSVLGWQITTSVPRYYCKWMWESLFSTLINIKDCAQMPNLQTLRTTLLGEVRGDKERATREAIAAFNRAIHPEKQ